MSEKKWKSTVPSRLEALGKLFAERSAIYGRDYVEAGKVLHGFFPDGFEMKTPEQFRSFYLFVFLVSKLNRYAQCMSRGDGHKDSLEDLAIYSQMLQELDEETGL